MTTIEKNIILAEFVGMVYDNHGQPNKYWELYDNCEFVCGKIYPQDKDLKFHSDLNWLIPVVRKISHIIKHELSINQYNVKIGYGQSLNPFDYSNESIVNSSVEFIKWYKIINKF